MSSKWTDILEGAGDASIGAALIRLARMATSVHHYEMMRQVGEDGTAMQRGEGDSVAIEGAGGMANKEVRR